MIFQIILLTLGILTFFYLILLAFNDQLVIKKYSLTTKKFNTLKSLKIVLISDTHSFGFGFESSALLEKISTLEVDLFCLTGDIFDDKRDLEETKCFLKKIAMIAPCYYVTGNHEKISPDYSKILDYLKEINIKILDGTADTLLINGEKINIFGVSDNRLSPFEESLKPLEKIEKEFKLAKNQEVFSLFLVHRPELCLDYLKYNFDLILSGHAHGGQFIIPKILNGIFTHGQGLLPKYAGGLYKREESNHIISRGLANTVFIPRIFNPLELVYIEIKSE